MDAMDIINLRQTILDETRIGLQHLENAFNGICELLDTKQCRDVWQLASELDKIGDCLDSLDRKNWKIKRA